jgi:hypothetical protein
LPINPWRNTNDHVQTATTNQATATHEPRRPSWLFKVGDEFEIMVIDVTEERMDVGFGLLKVPDGTTVAEVREKGIPEVGPEDPATFLFPEVTEEGTERVMSATLDVAGTWLVNCFAMGTGNPDGDDFSATTFEVVEKS